MCVCRCRRKDVRCLRGQPRSVLQHQLLLLGPLPVPLNRAQPMNEFHPLLHPNRLSSSRFALSMRLAHSGSGEWKEGERHIYSPFIELGLEWKEMDTLHAHWVNILLFSVVGILSFPGRLLLRRFIPQKITGWMIGSDQGYLRFGNTTNISWYKLFSLCWP